jgi:DNA-binding NtrC family response regulator
VLKNKHKILIVDDEPNICLILQAALERAGFAASTIHSAEDAVKLISEQQYELIISDVMMPGMTGVELLKHLNETSQNIPVLLMTAYGTIQGAVDAMRLGAVDYLTKPIDLEHLKKSVNFWIKTSQKTQKTSTKKTETKDLELIGESKKMKDVFELVQKVADSRATVLITGESGTGKEMIAKSIHKQSSRNKKPFIAISCAALPETLLESELFGHEKGAFTGADNMKQGRFELADGGTLFLDEIGEIPPLIQVKLLRVLQEREFERLGGTKPISVDVRLIAATNRNLQQAVEENTFRQDLLYRLQVIEIELPPLRERIEDIEPLVYHFLKKYQTTIQSVDDSVLDILKKHTWHGNVRELENCIERAIVLAHKNTTTLTTDLLPPSLQSAA